MRQYSAFGVLHGSLTQFRTLFQELCFWTKLGALHLDPRPLHFLHRQFLDGSTPEYDK